MKVHSNLSEYPNTVESRIKDTLNLPMPELIFASKRGQPLYKAPICWLLVSHQVLELKCMRAGGYCHYPITGGATSRLCSAGAAIHRA